MTPRRPRPFTWPDALILAAFFALGVAGAVLDDPGFLSSMMFAASRQDAWPGLPRWAKALEMPSKRVQSDFGAFLALMGLGVAVVTLRGGWGRLRRGGFPAPGVAASAAVATTLLVDLVLDVVKITKNGVWANIPATYWLTEAWHSSEFQSRTQAIHAAGAILGVWAYLILARSWRPRADWRDWLGRWLGWAWLGYSASTALFIALWG